MGKTVGRLLRRLLLSETQVRSAEGLHRGLQRSRDSKDIKTVTSVREITCQSERKR